MDRELTLEWESGNWAFIASVTSRSGVLVRAQLSGVSNPVLGGAMPPEVYGPQEVSAASVQALRAYCELLIMGKTGRRPILTRYPFGRCGERRVLMPWRSRSCENRQSRG